MAETHRIVHKRELTPELEIENKTHSTITAVMRKDVPLWNPIALREAVINAFVHCDYTLVTLPKLEIFSDRIEMTSAGSLPFGLSKKELFEGDSVPRNKELMRVFKDLQLVEQLGSGIPRILQWYGKSCFQFTDHFLRMTFPKTVEDDSEGGQIGGQIGGQMGGQMDGLRDILTNRQLAVFELIKGNPKITRKEIANKLVIAESAVQKHQLALIELKVIK